MLKCEQFVALSETAIGDRRTRTHARAAIVHKPGKASGWCAVFHFHVFTLPRCCFRPPRTARVVVADIRGKPRGLENSFDFSR